MPDFVRIECSDVLDEKFFDHKILQPQIDLCNQLEESGYLEAPLLTISYFRSDT